MEDVGNAVWLAAALTALVAGGGNAAAFAAHRAAGRARRWGARVLALVSLGVALQGAAGLAGALGGRTPPGLAGAAQVVAAAGALAVALAALRRR